MKPCECCCCKNPRRLIPKELLTVITDEDWLTLWDSNGSLKPFKELLPHIQAMPGMKEIYD